MRKTLRSVLLRNMVLIDATLMVGGIIAVLLRLGMVSFVLLSLGCFGIGIVMIFLGICPRIYMRYLPATLAFASAGTVSEIPSWGIEEIDLMKSLACYTAVLSALTALCIPTSCEHAK